MNTATSSTWPDGAVTVDDLQHYNVGELEELYRQAPEPESVRPLQGKPLGSMLAANGLDWKPVQGILRAFNNSPVFPWLGKGFSPEIGNQGTGINRMNLLGYTTEWFSFGTRLEPSVIDGRTCILLDYDHEGNPAPIRRIRDELREVSPGLYFGPAMARAADRHTLVLYFALDFNQGE